MLLDQNTIRIGTRDSFYDEYVFTPEAERALNDGRVDLYPGAIVGQVSWVPEYDAKGMFTKYPTEDAYLAAKALLDPTKKAGVSKYTNTKGQEVIIPKETKPLEKLYGIGKAPVGIGDGGAVTADDLDAMELLIVIENAYLGMTINHCVRAGEVTPVYRPISGDSYLVRCVPGSYKPGTPLYLIQTAKGVYAAPKKADLLEALGKLTAAQRTAMGFPADLTGYDPVMSNSVRMFSLEAFEVGPTNESQIPYPFLYDVEDDSTSNFPTKQPFAGAVVNLLRARIA